MNKTFVRLSASFFGCGYSPVASGTVGSIAALPMAWFLPDAAAWALLAVLTVVGFAVAPASREAFSSEDPQKFVLDEVCGMMLSVAGLPRLWQVYLTGFVLFRILDTLKPGPIGWIQHRKGAWSIMGDDLAAAAVVNVLLWWMVFFVL